MIVPTPLLPTKSSAIKPRLTPNISQSKGDGSILRVVGLADATYATPICRWAVGEPRPAAAVPLIHPRQKNQPLDIEPRRSPIKRTRANRPQSSRESKGAHLTERMVLLLEPLQAALLRHGKTLPAYTATAPAGTLKQSPRPPARPNAWTRTPNWGSNQIKSSPIP
jgi:hypothetical protein